MKAYLNNGITIEGTVAEIKEFLEGQHYTITCSTTDINNKTISSWNKKN